MFLALFAWGVAFAGIVLVSAASYQPVVAPGSLASLFGTDLAPDRMSATLDSQGRLPVELAGTSVEINDQPAELLFVSPSQINLRIPIGIEPGRAQVVVRAGFRAASEEATFSVASRAPAIFTLDGTQNGQGAVLNAVTYKLGPFVVETPENAGEDKRTRLAIFATGIGNAAPAIDDIGVLLRTAGGETYDLQVEYAGSQGTFGGLDQINVVFQGRGQNRQANFRTAAGPYLSNAVTIDLWSTRPNSVSSISPQSAQPMAEVVVEGSNFPIGLREEQSGDSLLQIVLLYGEGVVARVAPFQFTADRLRFLVPVSLRAWQGEKLNLCVQGAGDIECADGDLLIEPLAIGTVPLGSGILRFLHDARSQIDNTPVIDDVDRSVSAFLIQDTDRIIQAVESTLNGTPGSFRPPGDSGSTEFSALTVNDIAVLDALLLNYPDRFADEKQAKGVQQAELRPALQSEEDGFLDQASAVRRWEGLSEGVDEVTGNVLVELGACGLEAVSSVQVDAPAKLLGTLALIKVALAQFRRLWLKQVEVDPASVSVRPGDSVRFTLKGYFTFGQPVIEGVRASASVEGEILPEIVDHVAKELMGAVVNKAIRTVSGSHPRGREPCHRQAYRLATKRKWRANQQRRTNFDLGASGQGRPTDRTDDGGRGFKRARC